ncbi:hypothetical protein Q428_03425 [Fervidicella metallireducens AeB]|uniref:Sporulation integral membrane protein YtvI n=1 Tax=Fervidicella metallireducens AeB TaxID=1403537 RepID=A0A017RXM7_9CLOT|nr:AI-2E family transporter [Fervidicella metallireducens]EYE89341.1 hypothetical protein Q428_03425 [Fervidicella metallireducens AeB]
MYKTNQTKLKVIIITLLLIVLLKFCLIFLWPLVMAILLFFIFEPLVKKLEYLKVNRTFSVILSVFCLILVIGGVMYYLLKYSYIQVISFIDGIPELITTLSNKYSFAKDLKMSYLDVTNALEQMIILYKNKIIKSLFDVVNGIVYIFFIVTTSILLCIERNTIKKILASLIPTDYYILMNKILLKIIDMIKIQFKLVTITCVIMTIGLLVLDVKSPLTISLICGILDILPLVGPAIIFIPWIIFEFLVGNMFVGFGLLLLYILLQIVRQIMEIKFVGASVGINPLITILSLYFGIYIYGIWGIIIGPILVIVIKELYSEFFRKKGSTII